MMRTVPTPKVRPRSKHTGKRVTAALGSGRVTRDNTAALDEIRERFQVRPSDQDEVLRSLPASRS